MDFLLQQNVQLKQQLAQAEEKLEKLGHLEKRVKVLTDELAAADARARPLAQASVDPKAEAWAQDEDGDKALSIVVIGASGDLAFKKTYPALFSLHCHGLLPPDTIIAGYARSKVADTDFKGKISKHFTNAHDGAKKKDEFLSRCFYFAGQYDSPTDFTAFETKLRELEGKTGKKGANRVFYLAIPPTIFVPVGKGIQPAAMSKTGWNRVIVEKPFGRDSATSAELGKQLGSLFNEDQIYRIDHYLGKEMVQNLMILRFANAVFEPLWNREHIKSVVITFKEDFGTKGRGGYFDEFGIIRDVMQNHLLQVLTLVAMEPPVSMTAEDVRDEKVKLLRCIPPILLEDCVVGQYKADPKGSEPSYIEDPTVPKDSVTPTFAAAVLHINNYRWKGVPFILKCGKALNERKAEIRIQFKKPACALFHESEFSSNELVMRLQPDEAIYLKMSTKKPGLKGGIEHTEMDLSYRSRFGGENSKLDLPDAYERLILDVIRGDHNLFVRADELEAAWKIFTPLLHRIERERIQPILYDYGSRGPAEADELIAGYGYERTVNYTWKPPKL